MDQDLGEVPLPRQETPEVREQWLQELIRLSTSDELPSTVITELFPQLNLTVEHHLDELELKYINVNKTYEKILYQIGVYRNLLGLNITNDQTIEDLVKSLYNPTLFLALNDRRDGIINIIKEQLTPFSELATDIDVFSKYITFRYRYFNPNRHGSEPTADEIRFIVKDIAIFIETENDFFTTALQYWNLGYGIIKMKKPSISFNYYLSHNRPLEIESPGETGEIENDAELERLKDKLIDPIVSLENLLDRLYRSFDLPTRHQDPINYDEIKEKLLNPYFFYIYSGDRMMYTRGFVAFIHKLENSMKEFNRFRITNEGFKLTSENAHHNLSKFELFLQLEPSFFALTENKHKDNWIEFKRTARKIPDKTISFENYLKTFKKPQAVKIAATGTSSSTTGETDVQPPPPPQPKDGSTTGESSDGIIVQMLGEPSERYVSRLIEKVRTLFEEFDDIYSNVEITDPPTDNSDVFFDLQIKMSTIDYNYKVLKNVRLFEEELAALNYDEIMVNINDEYEDKLKQYKFLDKQEEIASRRQQAPAPRKRPYSRRTPVGVTVSPFIQSMRQEQTREASAVSISEEPMSAAPVEEALLEQQSRLKELVTFNKGISGHPEAYQSIVKQLNKRPAIKQGKSTFTKPQLDLRKKIEDSLRDLVKKRASNPRDSDKIQVLLKGIDEALYEIKFGNQEFCHLSIHSGDARDELDKPYTGSPISYVYNKVTDPKTGMEVAGTIGEWRTRNTGAIHLTLHRDGMTVINRTLLFKPVISAFKKSDSKGKITYKYFLQVKLFPNLVVDVSNFTTCELDVRDKKGKNIYIGRVIIDTLNDFLSSPEMAIPEALVPQDAKAAVLRELRGGRLTRKRRVNLFVTRKRIIRKSNKSRNPRKNRKIRKTNKN
jgi:hypothetical protein